MTRSNDMSDDKTMTLTHDNNRIWQPRLRQFEEETLLDDNPDYNNSEEKTPLHDQPEYNHYKKGHHFTVDDKLDDSNPTKGHH
jgi:hypothetical protein